MDSNKHQIKTIKQAWEEIITPDDYDYHMNMVGQDEPLAIGWMNMLRQFPPQDGGLFWIAGGGTAKFLDIVDREWLKQTKLRFILTDVSKHQLSKADERIKLYNLQNQFSVRIHNLLVDKPVENATEASLSLVLEYLEDWQGALARLVSKNIHKLYIQIQTYNQTTNQHLVTQQPQLKPSIQKFVNLIKEGKISPQRIEIKPLTQLLESKGFTLLLQDDESVPNSKIMTSLVSRRNEP